MKVVIELDPATRDRLLEDAAREMRPPAWHALVLLRRILGTEFLDATPADRDAAEAHDAASR